MTIIQHRLVAGVVWIVRGFPAVESRILDSAGMYPAHARLVGDHGVYRGG